MFSDVVRSGVGRSGAIRSNSLADLDQTLVHTSPVEASVYELAYARRSYHGTPTLKVLHLSTKVAHDHDQTARRGVADRPPTRRRCMACARCDRGVAWRAIDGAREDRYLLPILHPAANYISLARSLEEKEQDGVQI